MPRLGPYSFPGLKKSEAENLREKLDLRSGIVVNENLKRTSINIIRNYYIEKGHFNVTVRDSVAPDNMMPNSVRLLFIVDKGAQVKVETITIQGENFLTEKKIKRAMKNTKEKAWWRIFKSSKFMEPEFEADLEKVIAKYNKEGFPKCANHEGFDVQRNPIYCEH